MKKESILDQLKEYRGIGYYPFHMPGHKRSNIEEGLALPNPFLIDITEIEGFDNLHQPEGILKESMKRAAQIYGSDETHYLVNGSSCGILSGICGCTSPGGKLLISRNCHKSVYHGILLNQLQTEYIYPQIIKDLGIQGGILPEDVEKKLKNHPEIQAVVMVSPTYEGMVSDIEKISQIVHRYHIPLIVDEAHGAHFSFGEEGEFPISALQKGADVVIQSLHKTLPSLTQTAILHMKEKYLGKEGMERIRRYLSIFQSSSPSYVFMISMENCIRYMEQKGRKRLSQFHQKLMDLYEIQKKLQHIIIPGNEWIGQAGVYDKDSSKILMMPESSRKNGVWLKDYLKVFHHLELEMCTERYSLALTSLLDSQESLDKLKRGIYMADQEIQGEERIPLNISQDFEAWNTTSAYTIAEAVDMPSQLERLEQCAGRLSAEFVAVYPPGIPCLVPGEQISHKMVEALTRYWKIGLTIMGATVQENGMFLKVLTEKDERVTVYSPTGV